GARQLAVRRPSLSALVEEGGVVDLVVRGIQLDLIHVHPYAGAFLVGRGADPAFLGERPGRDGGGRGGERRSPAEQGPIEYRLTRHVFPPRMSRVARSFGARAGPAWTKSALPSMHTVRRLCGLLTPPVQPGACSGEVDAGSPTRTCANE